MSCCLPYIRVQYSLSHSNKFNSSQSNFPSCRCLYIFISVLTIELQILDWLPPHYNTLVLLCLIFVPRYKNQSSKTRKQESLCRGLLHFAGMWFMSKLNIHWTANLDGRTRAEEYILPASWMSRTNKSGRGTQLICSEEVEFELFLKLSMNHQNRRKTVWCD